MLPLAKKTRGGMSTMTTLELEALKAANREVWGRTASVYTAGFEKLTIGAAEPLLDAAGVGRDTALLDVGTGPGTLIGPALSRGAVVHAVDLSDRMVDTARARHTDVDIQVGDAHALPFDDASFDAVTMGFCLHHIPEPGLALAEAKRVLRPGGRVAFSVWGPGPLLELFGLVFEIIGRLVELDGGPSLQAAAIGDDLRDYEVLLAVHGLEQPWARLVDIAWLLTDGSSVFEGFDRYFDLSSQPETIRRAIRDELDAAVRQRADATGRARIPNPAVVAAARRPVQ
jgi:SAM-dependent methyltransferase